MQAEVLGVFMNKSAKFNMPPNHFQSNLSMRQAGVEKA
jgi:hypothetical protein